MAWRLDQTIVHGEIDNRQRGKVFGTLWLLGRNDPIQLILTGNCHRDLAGCLLKFENPNPQPGNRIGLDARQEGVVGDMTASRKARILDVSLEEAGRLHDENKPVPEHMGNCLYLEWFSETDGRVLIETTDFQHVISARQWTMTETGEVDRINANRQALRDWLDRRDEMCGPDDAEYDPEADKPMNEFQWEKHLKESDARSDKYMELIEKYRGHPDSEKLIAREMGWDWLEDALEADARGAFEAEKAAEKELPDDIPEFEPNPLTEGVDWIRDERGYIRHPLQQRMSEVAMAMWHHCDDRDLLGENGDEDLREMLFQAQTTGAKLAGALNTLAHDRDIREAGLIIASLKRALTYLNSSLAAAACVAEKKLIEAERLESFRQSLFAIREEMLALMERFRES